MQNQEQQSPKNTKSIKKPLSAEEKSLEANLAKQSLEEIKKFQKKKAERFAKPIESEVLESLGAEVEEELTAEEKAERKAKMSPKEQVANYLNSDEWHAWMKYKDITPETSTEKLNKVLAKNTVLMELDELKKPLKNDPESLHAIDNIKKLMEEKEITIGKVGHA